MMSSQKQDARLLCFYLIYQSFDGFPGGSVGEGSACSAGHLGSIPELGRSPGGRHGNPLQYSWLKNPTDWAAWQAKSQTGLKWLSMHAQLTAQKWRPQSQNNKEPNFANNLNEQKMTFPYSLRNKGSWGPFNPVMPMSDFWPIELQYKKPGVGEEICVALSH